MGEANSSDKWSYSDSSGPFTNDRNIDVKMGDYGMSYTKGQNPNFPTLYHTNITALKSIKSKYYYGTPKCTTLIQGFLKRIVKTVNNFKAHAKAIETSAIFYRLYVTRNSYVPVYASVNPVSFRRYRIHIQH